MDRHYAAAEGRIDDLRSALAAGDDPNAADREGFTPLHFAARSLDADAAEALLAAGADVMSRSVFGATPLHIALVNVYDSPGRIVGVLLRAGADPDVENNYGVSPQGLADWVSNFDLKRFFTNEERTSHRRAPTAALALGCAVCRP